VPTVERVVGNGYGLYLMPVTMLMSILLVTRHTRVEEQRGPRSWSVLTSSAVTLRSRLRS